MFSNKGLLLLFLKVYHTLSMAKQFCFVANNQHVETTCLLRVHGEARSRHDIG